MKKHSARIGCVLLLSFVLLSSPTKMCAQRKVELVEQEQYQETESRGLKRKVAVGRFSNETQYAKGLFYDKENDPMGKQALDILSSKLAASGKFILIERSDVRAVEEECKLNGSSANTLGADYLIIGSVTEFGRKTVGKEGVFTAEKSQVVQASVSIRLVDTSNGLIIYSDEASGEASTTSKSGVFTSNVAGFDATLSDKAISMAIGQLVDNIIEKCTDKPWRTFFIAAEDGNLILAGGNSQGINVGDDFIVKTKGKQVKNPLSGVMMELPGKVVGKIKILQTGGDTPETEFSFAEVVESNMDIPSNISALVIEEIREDQK